jgi:hypothetical protein
MLTILHRTALLTAMIAAGAATAALAQATATDPHHPEQAATETPSSVESGATADQVQGAQPGQPGQMGPGMMSGMMGSGMMGHGMMGGMEQPGMIGPGTRMHGHMMRIMLAITDADGDGAISFEEATEIHRRIFQAIDADEDGKVTVEEISGFIAQ